MRDIMGMMGKVKEMQAKMEKAQAEIAALSIEAGMAPGSPLCRAWSTHPSRDGLQIVLKGGQMGDEGFFGAVRAGRT